MRKDMSKVIVERPRTGGKYDRPGRKSMDPDDMPRTESMKRAHKDRKSFSDNLGPLKRFLTSAVGRPWNDVYSEISAQISGTSTVQRHILQHVFQFVERYATIVGKKVFKQPSRFGAYYELWNEDLYVDPVTGILKKYRRKSKLKRTVIDYFDSALNAFAKEGSRTVVKDGEVFKVYKNKDTGEWSLYVKAQPIHAKLDMGGLFYMKRDHLKHFFKKYPETEDSDSPYFKTLWSGWRDFQKIEADYARREREKALISVGDEVEVLRDGVWQHGAVNKEAEGYRGKHWMLTMDDGTQFRVDHVGSHDKIRKKQK